MSLLDPVTDYAVRVVSGAEIAGPHVRATCRRHLSDLDRTNVWFDYEAAFRVIKFFETQLRLSEGQFEGLPFLLHPSQKFVLGSLFGWKRPPDVYFEENGPSLDAIARVDWVRRFRRAYIEMAKGNGKALDVETPVPTPDGWRLMRDMRVGDRVFDENGRVCNVTAVSEIMRNRPCRRLQFSDGAQIVADINHLWRTTSRDGTAIRTTGEIVETLDRRHEVDSARTIVRCDGHSSVPVRCISVDSPSRMYLAGEHMIPTHNSPLAAGIGLYGMMADREPGAQVYSVASTRAQADVLFQDAVKMVNASPAMKSRITQSGNAKVYNLAALPMPWAGSFFRPVSRNVGKTGSGPRPSIVLADELHEHPNREALQILERGFKFRRQPMLVMLTNSGSDKNSVCWEEHEAAVKIAHGDVENDAVFSYVCASDDGEDPFTNETSWRKTNPLFGTILTRKYLQDNIQLARENPGNENMIRRLHFCQWTGSDKSWISREDWEAIEDPDLDIGDFVGRRCYGGLDLASRKDLVGKALVFDDGFVKDEKTGEMLPKYAAFVHGYTPGDTLEKRAKADKAPYDVWVKGGWLTAPPGKFVRFEFVVKDLHGDSQRFDLACVAYDRWLIDRFEEVMGDMNVTLPLVEHPQGYNKRKLPKKEDENGPEEEQENPLWMPRSIEHLEELVHSRRLRVQCSPALRSSVAGAVFLTSPAGLHRFDKAKATQRIDLLIALTMAVGAAEAKVVETSGSLYEQLARMSEEQRRELLGEDEEEFYDEEEWR